MKICGAGFRLPNVPLLLGGSHRLPDLLGRVHYVVLAAATGDRGKGTAPAHEITNSHTTGTSQVRY